MIIVIITPDDPLLREQITGFEGVRLKPYTDTRHNMSIGIGRNLTDVGLFDDEVTYLFTNDLRRAIDDLAIFPWFATLDLVRQRVLVDMRFQLGPTGLRNFTLMIAAVGRGDYQKAAQEMRHSLWAREVPRRAEILAERMERGS